jgi:hypothetical protein
MQMSNYRIHALVYGTFFGMLFVALATNYGPLGKYYGAVAGASMDPGIFLPALLLGSLLLRPRYLFPALLTLAILLSWFIYERNLDWLGRGRFDAFWVFVRFTAYSLWALIPNAFRVARTNKKISTGLVKQEVSSSRSFKDLWGKYTATKLTRLVLVMAILQVGTIAIAFIADWDAAAYIEDIVHGYFSSLEDVWLLFLPTYVIAGAYIFGWVGRGE